MAQIFDRITVNPQQCGGRPCVRGMRIRVSDVLELLAEGMTPEQILDEHPDLELEDIHACLRFASPTREHPDPCRMIVWLDAQLSPRLPRWIEETFGVECLHVRAPRS